MRPSIALTLAACLALHAVVAVAAAGAGAAPSFDAWAATHHKSYATAAARASAERAYAANLALIERQNAEANGASGTAVFAPNAFADVDRAAFLRARAMPSLGAAPVHEAARYERPSDAAPLPLPTALPVSLDWRAKGAVTAVRDQQSSGTCWAFSTAQNVEGVHFLAGNPLIELSPEQLVDCDANADVPNKHADCGVFGGWPYLSFQHIITAGGLASGADVPYCSGGDGPTPCFPCPPLGFNEALCGPPASYCNASYSTCGTKPSAKISSWRAISTNETVIQQELAATGPLSVLIDAALLQSYSSGVIAPSSWCDPTALDHAVLLVGWGVDTTGVAYWTVKNSWGASWGEQGYFRMQLGVGTCGINTAVTTSVA